MDSERILYRYIPNISYPNLKDGLFKLSGFEKCHKHIVVGNGYPET